MYRRLPVTLLLMTSFSVQGASLLFSEKFENQAAIENNGGAPGSNGWVKFVAGVAGHAGDFSGSKSLCYPLAGHFDAEQGTVEFWVKTPNMNHIGFFDIGSLGRANSWGIYKNKNHFIMEVKDQNNRFKQAWIPTPIIFDEQWHFVTALWQRQNDSTNFKICYDGQCKAKYDGAVSHTFPAGSSSFCVGWTGFYGHSESLIDELNIFSGVKTDAEILTAFETNMPDRTSPVITLFGNPALSINMGEDYQELGASAVDNKDGDISHKIILQGQVDSATEGAYRISYNTQDAAGNHANEQVRTVYVVDYQKSAVSRAYVYMKTRMDQFNESFDIYSDLNAGGNHATPSGWMGAIDILEINPQWRAGCFNGLTCFQNIWETNKPGWVGIRWLQPDKNWAETANAGYDLTGATQLSFKVRGELGGELVEFVVGGVKGDFPDSLQPSASTGSMILTKEWQEVVLDLTGRDLSHVLSPFGWIVKIDPIFYIDDVKIDLARPDALRFIQSFEILNYAQELALANTAYVYDNALALMAFLARGEADDLRRAKILADAFVFVLDNDRAYSDGRLRNAYSSGDLSEPTPGTAKPPGWWDIEAQKWFEDEFNVSIHTGNMAFPMLALLAYYEQQGGEQYLAAVLKMAEWVERETRDERGEGGYTGGYQGWEQTKENPNPPQKLLYKATEHNIDLYPVFVRLHQHTGEEKWLERAEHAKKFVAAMWNAEAHHFWTGTQTDGITANKDNIPVDIHPWSVMSLRHVEQYQKSMQWSEENCLLEADGFTGFDFNCAFNGHVLDAVWFEGTAQAALAFKLIKQTTKAEFYLKQLKNAQISATNNNGKGLVAASRDNLSTGFDWEYFSRLHLGPTAWYLLAEMNYNPYWGRSNADKPVPEMKANDSVEPLTIFQGSALTVSASLNPVYYNGKNADWWVAASSPFGLYWFTLDQGWVRSDAPIRVYGGPLFTLLPYTILDLSSLPQGSYTFYFGVDDVMDNFLNAPYVDAISVTIQ